MSDFVELLRVRAEEFRLIAENTAEEHTKKSLFELARSYTEWAEAEEIAAAATIPR
ncbi:hypothetical protein JQ543_21185 [Bradyrhizobium diazoefficiens]|nr:hypothetical protein [Bradyrhizobium diazoefficiens]MBR0850274.1 hypothetical protein [Bradyrhizobium diazoefficiens]